MIKLNLPQIYDEFGCFFEQKRACGHIDKSRNMFASPQCLGYKMEHGEMTLELCYPSKDTILKQVRDVVKKTKAKAVFVATDDNPLLQELKDKLKKLKVRVFENSVITLQRYGHISSTAFIRWST